MPVEQPVGNDGEVATMAEHDTDQLDSAAGLQGRQGGQPSGFAARLLANLALGMELQRAHRSRIGAV